MNIILTAYCTLKLRFCQLNQLIYGKYGIILVIKDQ